MNTSLRVPFSLVNAFRNLRLFAWLLAIFATLASLQAQSNYATSGAFSTLAGYTGAGAPQSGSTDGPGSTAKFYGPRQVAVDGSGNVYVADSDNHVIRKIAATGEVTTWAGTAGGIGSADGTGSAAQFNNPAGVAVDSSGNVYVADVANNTIRKISPARVVTTLAGTAGTFGTTNGTGSDARFYFPGDIAVDGSGNLFVADTANNLIRKITPAGIVTTFFDGSAGELNIPSGVAVDSAGSVYVADSGNNAIKKITSDGVIALFAGSGDPVVAGSADGNGSAARFFYPRDVALDSAGNVYVADYNNQLIRKIAPGGTVTTLAGLAESTGLIDGTGSAARFNNPSGLAVDATTTIYVADSSNHAIRKGVLLPSITTQPVSQTATLGNPVTFSVTASGTSPLAYQWKKGGVNIGGATNSSYTIASVGASDAGSYSVAVTNSGGSTTSDAAVFTFAQAPQATLSVNSSASGTFGSAYTATATGGSGTGALTWSLGVGSSAPGAAINSSTGSVTSTGAGAVVIKATKASDTNYLSATSADFTVTLGKAAAAVTLGNLSATYNGSAHAATATTTPASLAVTFTYNGSATAPTNTGSYAVIGTIYDSNYQGSTSGTLVIAQAVSVITWAAPSPIFFGTALSGTQLNASANTPGTFLYSPAAGEIKTAGIHTLSVSFTPTDTVNYSGASAQQSLVVNVANGAPLFLTQPTSQSVPVGSSCTFTAFAIGAPEPTYQWKKDGVNINGATGSSYTIASVAVSDAGSYTVVATNSVAAQPSLTAVLSPYIAAPTNAVISISVE